MRTIHVSLETRGAIRNFVPREWKNVVTDRETGRVLSPAEVKDFFLDQLAQGHERIPFGEPCEGFDFKTGCPGHAAAEAAGPTAGGPT